jgi:hypothetical protein
LRGSWSKRRIREIRSSGEVKVVRRVVVGTGDFLASSRTSRPFELEWLSYSCVDGMRWDGRRPADMIEIIASREPSFCERLWGTQGFLIEAVEP